MRIVIVDDRPSDLDLLRQILEREGHTTLEASDGIAALEILHRESVDAVMTDVLMPRMDGFRLCHEIRADDRLFNLPIVVYTGTYTSETDEDLALKIGADKYLRKPAPIASILATLHEAITVQHSAPTTKASQEVEVLNGYNKQLVMKLEERNTELELRLSLAGLEVDVGLALVHEETLRQILQRCSEAFVRHLGVALVRVWTHDGAGNTLELEASAGMYTLLDESPERISAGQLSIAGVVEERRPRVVNFVIGDPRFAEQEWARHEGLTAFAGYPLILGDHMFGALAIFARLPLARPILDKTATIADALALGIERKRVEKALCAALVEKVALQQEVHHRVNNNMQVIGSLLSMQIAQGRNGGLNSQPLNDAYSRILAMSMIHRQIQQSESLSELNFGEYVEQLSENLFSSRCSDPSGIRLELKVEAIYLDLDQSIPCGLILNELLTNSLKHAFVDGRSGCIRVCIRKTETGDVELSVADTGIGLPADFVLEECGTLGLQVVQILAKQLRADLCLSTENGVTLTLTWRHPKPESIAA